MSNIRSSFLARNASATSRGLGSIGSVMGRMNSVKVPNMPFLRRGAERGAELAVAEATGSPAIVKQSDAGDALKAVAELEAALVARHILPPENESFMEGLKRGRIQLGEAQYSILSIFHLLAALTALELKSDGRTLLTGNTPLLVDFENAPCEGDAAYFDIQKQSIVKLDTKLDAEEAAKLKATARRAFQPIFGLDKSTLVAAMGVHWAIQNSPDDFRSYEGLWAILGLTGVRSFDDVIDYVVGKVL